MDRRKKIARRVVERGADYVLAIKKNQPHLWEDTAGDFRFWGLRGSAGEWRTVFLGRWARRAIASK